MKVTIDTNAKTISVDSENLGELFAELEILLPNGEWKNYRLLQATQRIINIQPYISPVLPNPQPYYPNPLYPTWCGGGTQC